MKHYQVNEFIQNCADNYIPNAVDKKVSLLYDFCILRRRRNSSDARETAVREWLSHYTTESQMTSALHNILVGDSTLNNTLKKAGYVI
jgi:hypothetical protein